jgi:RNA polymerase sigma-70 factor (ECF subfamily)
VNVDGGPALIVRLDGQIDGVLALRVAESRVSGIHYVRDAEKLSWPDEEAAFSR